MALLKIFLTGVFFISFAHAMEVKENALISSKSRQKKHILKCCQKHSSMCAM